LTQQLVVDLYGAGSGTSGDPYTLGLITSCSTSEVLMWTGSAWGCSFPTAPFAQYSDATGGTDVNSVLYIPIPWDTEDFEETGFTHTGSASSVTMDLAGTYRITYSVSAAKSTGTRSTVKCAVRLNGSTVTGESYATNSDATDSDLTNTGNIIVSTAGASEYYEVVCNRAGGDAASPIIASESWSTVERIR